jgi:hypothetical protein
MGNLEQRLLFDAVRGLFVHESPGMTGGKTDREYVIKYYSSFIHLKSTWRFFSLSKVTRPANVLIGIKSIVT